MKLDDAGIADQALRDPALAQAVARHKSAFFAGKDGIGQSIDYGAAVAGRLLLVPNGSALEGLAEDYVRMIADGLLLDEAPAFDTVIERCRRLQERANDAARRR